MSESPSEAADMEQSTADRILAGALLALGEHGVETLSMREISEAAGVSRGTLYRYFKSREELLRAAARYDQARFDHGAHAAMQQAAAGPDQLRGLLQYAHGFVADHPSRWMVKVDPGFLLAYLDERLPETTATLAEVLRPTLELSDPVRSGLTSVEELAELVIRLIVSMYLVPAGGSNAPLDTVTALIMGTPGGD
jgi:AcrR family transcriptional regulator